MKLSQPLSEPQILFQDKALTILFKPAKWFVHPPEDPRHRRGLKRKTCVQWLMDHHGLKASPAHRIDAGTEGVLIFGNNKDVLQNLNLQFQSHTVEKTYHAVVRGWIKEPTGRIDISLPLDSTATVVPCLTDYETLAQVEQNFSTHPKFPTSRYSLLKVKPKTGRWHQIRRHMNRISHPIVGDSEHGDLRHNRYFREDLHIEGLCLRASEITFQHPESLERITFTAPVTSRWEAIQNLFRLKPL